MSENNQVRPMSSALVINVAEDSKKMATKPLIKTVFPHDYKPNLKNTIPLVLTIFLIFSVILVSYFIVVLAIGKPSCVENNFRVL